MSNSLTDYLKKKKSLIHLNMDKFQLKFPGFQAALFSWKLGTSSSSFVQEGLTCLIQVFFFFVFVYLMISGFPAAVYSRGGPPYLN